MNFKNECHERRVIGFLERHMAFDEFGCISHAQFLQKFEEYNSTQKAKPTPELVSELYGFIKERGVREVYGSYPPILYFRGIRPQTDYDRNRCERGDAPVIKGEDVNRAAKSPRAALGVAPLRPYLNLDRLAEDLSVVGQDYTRALDTLHKVCLVAGIDAYSIDTNSIDPDKVLKGIETLKSRFTLALNLAVSMRASMGETQTITIREAEDRIAVAMGVHPSVLFPNRKEEEAKANG